MSLIKTGARYIRQQNDISTDLEEALLEKIEHMEARIEELEDDLEKEKNSHSKTDDDWRYKYGFLKEEKDDLWSDYKGLMDENKDLLDEIRDLQSQLR